MIILSYDYALYQKKKKKTKQKKKANKTKTLTCLGYLGVLSLEFLVLCIYYFLELLGNRKKNYRKMTKSIIKYNAKLNKLATKPELTPLENVTNKIVISI